MHINCTLTMGVRKLGIREKKFQRGLATRLHQGFQPYLPPAPRIVVCNLKKRGGILMCIKTYCHALGSSWGRVTYIYI